MYATVTLVKIKFALIYVFLFSKLSSSLCCPKSRMRDCCPHEGGGIGGV